MNIVLNIGKTVSMLVVLLSACAVGAQQSKYTLHDFAAHETDIKPLQHKAIAEFANALDSQGASCIRIVGHSAQWRNITKEEYCARSLTRAQGAASVLKGILKNKGKTVKIISEEQARLGDTGSCIGSPLIEVARCPMYQNEDVVVVLGARSINEPLVENLIESSSVQARANRSQNRRVEMMLLGFREDYTSCPAPLGNMEGATEGASANELKRNTANMLERLPLDREAFVERVLEIAHSDVNLPALFKTFFSKNPEYEKPIRYKKIDLFAKANASNHYKTLLNTIQKAEPKKPSWLKNVNKVLSQPNAHRIDPFLALSISLREAGLVTYDQCRKKPCSPIVNSAVNGGLDNLYRYRKTLRKERLIPKSFSDLIKSGSKTGFKNSGNIPRDTMAAFGFAYIGFMEIILIREMGNVYFSDIENKESRFTMAADMFASASPLARRAWTQLSLGGKSYVISYLQHFRNLNLPLDAIKDIPGSVNDLSNLTNEQRNSKRKLKRRADVKRAKKYYNAIKIAVIAEALQQMQETPCETDRRTYPFLISE